MMIHVVLVEGTREFGWALTDREKAVALAERESTPERVFVVEEAFVDHVDPHHDSRLLVPPTEIEPAPMARVTMHGSTASVTYDAS